VQLAGDVDDLLANHYRLTGPRRAGADLPSDQFVIEASHTDRQSTYFIRTDRPILDPTWTVESVDLETLVLAYMRQSHAAEQVRPARLGAVR
jgi:ABC-2 type transport system ATP-binding protein